MWYWWSHDYDDHCDDNYDLHYDDHYKHDDHGNHDDQRVTNDPGASCEHDNETPKDHTMS